MCDESSSSLDGKGLSNLRVVDLKQELEKRGLSKSGSKKDLVKRLKQTLELEKLYESSPSGDGEQKLVLDEATEQNEFVKKYLAEQAERRQKEVQRLMELEETQRLEENVCKNISKNTEKYTDIEKVDPESSSENTLEESEEKVDTCIIDSENKINILKSSEDEYSSEVLKEHVKDSESQSGSENHKVKNDTCENVTEIMHADSSVKNSEDITTEKENIKVPTSAIEDKSINEIMVPDSATSEAELVNKTQECYRNLDSNKSISNDSHDVQLPVISNKTFQNADTTSENIVDFVEQNNDFSDMKTSDVSSVNGNKSKHSTKSENQASSHKEAVSYSLADIQLPGSPVKYKSPDVVDHSKSSSKSERHSHQKHKESKRRDSARSLPINSDDLVKQLMCYDIPPKENKLESVDSEQPKQCFTEKAVLEKAIEKNKDVVIKSPSPDSHCDPGIEQNNDRKTKNSVETENDENSMSKSNDHEMKKEEKVEDIEINSADKSPEKPFKDEECRSDELHHSVPKEGEKIVQSKKEEEEKNSVHDSGSEENDAEEEKNSIKSECDKNDIEVKSQKNKVESESTHERKKRWKKRHDSTSSTDSSSSSSSSYSSDRKSPDKSYSDSETHSDSQNFVRGSSRSRSPSSQDVNESKVDVNITSSKHEQKSPVMQNAEPKLRRLKINRKGSAADIAKDPNVSVQNDQLKIKRKNSAADITKDPDDSVQNDCNPSENIRENTPEDAEQESHLPSPPKEFPEPQQKRRKIHLTSLKSNKEKEENQKSEGKRRRWGNYGASLQKNTVSISTDSLKTLIPDFKITCGSSALSDSEDMPRKSIDSPPSKEIKPFNSYPHSEKETETTHEAATEKSEMEVVEEINEDSCDAEKMEAVMPSSNPRSKTLFIKNLVRPFTLIQLKELLKQTGDVVEEGFWIDKIKSKCFVTYKTESQAVRTRETLHGVRWPSSNPKILSVDFATEEELDHHRNGTEPRKAPVQHTHSERQESKHVAPVETGRQREREERRKEKTKQNPVYVREWDKDKLLQESPKRHSTQDTEKSHSSDKKKDKKDSKKKPDEDTPAKLLDDLFHKTKTLPCIYWLPLNEEEVKEREEERKRRRMERERRKQEEEADRQNRRRAHSGREKENRSRSRSPVSRRR